MSEREVERWRDVESKREEERESGLLFTSFIFDLCQVK